jgi:sialate O-acetylesterase
MKLILSLLLCGLAAAAQNVTLVSGPAPETVLQRDAAGMAAAAYELRAPGSDGRKVEGRILGGKAKKDWVTLGTVAAGAFKGSLPNIPTGGPYRLEVRIGDHTEATPGVLVGDLWVLAGQSNMEGVGDLVNVHPPHPQVHSFDMNDVWLEAREPLHSLPNAKDSFHWRGKPRLEGEELKAFIANRRKGAGLGLPFAAEYVRLTGVPVGLVPCAHGGTSMDQWSPALKAEGGASLYGAMLRRINAVGGRVKGLLWYQGESDASAKPAPLFAEKFATLIRSLRDDVQMPQLPFYFVQLGRHISTGSIREWNAVQLAQLAAETSIPHTAMITAVDTELDDAIHVGTEDLKLLGRRFAAIAAGTLPGGPRPVSATYSVVNPEARLNSRFGVIRVRFERVNGGLKANGFLRGFAVYNAAGEYTTTAFRANIDAADPNQVLVHVQGAPPVEGAELRYGFGKDPYCNLRDNKDMGVPVFTLPIRLQP